MFEYWMESDINSLPKVHQLTGRDFSQDSGANKIGVRVTDHGQAVTLSGNVNAWIIRPDGTTIQQSGSRSGNAAWVILPSGAYAQEGKICVSIRLVNGSEVTTLGCVEGYVYKSM